MPSSQRVYKATQTKFMVSQAFQLEQRDAEFAILKAPPTNLKHGLDKFVLNLPGVQAERLLAASVHRRYGETARSCSGMTAILQSRKQLTGKTGLKNLLM